MHRECNYLGRFHGCPEQETHGPGSLVSSEGLFTFAWESLPVHVCSLQRLCLAGLKISAHLSHNTRMPPRAHDFDCRALCHLPQVNCALACVQTYIVQSVQGGRGKHRGGSEEGQLLRSDSWRQDPVHTLGAARPAPWHKVLQEREARQELGAVGPFVLGRMLWGACLVIMLGILAYTRLRHRPGLQSIGGMR